MCTEDVSVKEETLAKEAEDIEEDTNVSTSEGEEKDLKVEEVCGETKVHTLISINTCDKKELNGNMFVLQGQ